MLESTLVLFEVKTCAKCGKCKQLEAFVRQGSGYRSVCKSCRSARERKLPSPTSVFVRTGIAAGYRRCPKCNEVKLDAEFYVRPNGRYASYCRPCMATYQRKYVATPEGRARSNAAVARWKAANPEYDKKFREDNADLYREFGRVASSRRRARLAGLAVEDYTLEQILERDGIDCVLCGEELDLDAVAPAPWAATVEHLECISWPGSAGDVFGNVAAAHATCNFKRHNNPHPAAARKRAELLAAEQLAPTLDVCSREAM